jgi:SAM-dependent methyltransferase
MHPEEYQRIYAVEEVHWWYAGLRALVLSLLQRFLAAPMDRSEKGGALRPSILDAGCGTGGLASRMAVFATVTGLDLFPEAIRYSRTRGLTRLVAGSVEALPFAASTFDAVVSLDVLYHAAVADDQHAARELARVLRPGGILVINLPAYDWLRGHHDVTIHTARRYSRGRVCALLKGAGLRVEWVSHWNGLLLPAAVSFRVAQRLVARPVAGRSDVGPVHPVLNQAFATILAVERRLIGLSRLPFGLSVLAVGRRMAGPEG